jgi:hypothetical protein
MVRRMEVKNSDITVSSISEKWKEYGIFEYYLSFKNRKPTHKAIVKDDSLIAIMSDNYGLFPNEEALKLAKNIGLEYGATPFAIGPASWYSKMDENTFVSNNGRVMRSLYSFNDPVSVNEDLIYMGFSVNNSIDGTLAFSISGWLYKPENNDAGSLVFFGRTRNISSDVLTGMYKRHTRQLNAEIEMSRIKKSIDGVLNEMSKLSEKLLEFNTTIVDSSSDVLARLVKSRLPQKSIPSYIRYDKKTGDLSIEGNITMYRLYFDVLSYINRVGTEFITKNVLTKQVNRVFGME